MELLDPKLLLADGGLGDEPCQPMVSPAPSPAVLDIEDCASDWELQCPKRWENLSLTSQSNERFCGTCKETVFFCSTKEELAEHVGQRHCVAFDLREEALDDDRSKILICVALLGGSDLPPVRVNPSQTVAFLKGIVAVSSGIPANEQRLLLDEIELHDGQSLAEVGVTAEVHVQLARVPPKRLERRKTPPTRKMGTRRPPPKPPKHPPDLARADLPFRTKDHQ